VAENSVQLSTVGAHERSVAESLRDDDPMLCQVEEILKNCVAAGRDGSNLEINFQMVVANSTPWSVIDNSDVIR